MARVRSTAPASDRRRTAGQRREVNVGKRRPRFLTRRKCGETRRTKAWHRDEREIICYE